MYPISVDFHECSPLETPEPGNDEGLMNFQTVSLVSVYFLPKKRVLIYTWLVFPQIMDFSPQGDRSWRPISTTVTRRCHSFGGKSQTFNSGGAQCSEEDALIIYIYVYIYIYQCVLKKPKHICTYIYIYEYVYIYILVQMDDVSQVCKLHGYSKPLIENRPLSRIKLWEFVLTKHSSQWTNQRPPKIDMEHDGTKCMCLKKWHIYTYTKHTCLKHIIIYPVSFSQFHATIKRGCVLSRENKGPGPYLSWKCHSCRMMPLYRVPSGSSGDP